MSAQAGNLNWRRARLTLPAGDTVVDTGLEVANRAYNTTGGPSNPVDPPLGITAASPGPADGTEPASRVMVIPLVPMAPWDNVSIGEPYVDSTTGRVNVVMSNAGGGGSCEDVTFNLVFIDDEAVSPPTYDVTEDTTGPACSVTLTITNDANGGRGNATLADAEAALALAGYTASFTSVDGNGTSFAPANFAAAPGNTWSTEEPCSDPLQWDMGNLAGPSIFGPLTLPQVAEQPPNVLLGTVDAPEDTFGCDGGDVTINVLFWAPHTKEGPGDCDTYNAEAAPA